MGEDHLRQATRASRYSGRSQTELEDAFRSLLTDKYSLDALPPYCVLVEGKTDRIYLERAAKLVHEVHRLDLLELPASFGAGVKDVIEYGALIFPVRTELRRTVEADFPDISRLRQEVVEKPQFGLALMGRLRMQA